VVPLMGTHEIGLMLGVSRPRVFQLTQGAQFPEPLAVLGMGKVWRTRDVLKWARAAGRGDAADAWEAAQV
jgi:prophage regulatory protein